MRGRSFNSPNYRYGFNGMEKNEDGEFGSQTTYTTMYRQYNPAIGRWLSVDPKNSTWSTPYSGMGNNPILNIDILGDTIGFPNINTQFGYDFQRDLNLLYKGEIGKSLIRHVHANEKIVEIYDASSIFAGDQGDVLNSKAQSSGLTPMILFEASEKVELYYAQREAFEIDGTSDMYSFIVLAHELFHAKDLMNGETAVSLGSNQKRASNILIDIGEELENAGIKTKDLDFPTEIAELRAMIHTNQVRLEHGMTDLRTNYSGVELLESDGVTPLKDYNGVDVTREIFDSENN